MLEFFKKIFGKKQNSQMEITVSVNGKKIDNIDEEKLAELFKELSENIKKNRV